jgi:hypothetical protein
MLNGPIWIVATCSECGAAYTEHARLCQAGAQAAVDLVTGLLGLAAFAPIDDNVFINVLPPWVDAWVDDSDEALSERLLSGFRVSLLRSKRAASRDGD